MANPGSAAAIDDTTLKISKKQSQWRIQDFPDGWEGEAAPKVGAPTYYFGHFPQFCRKLKKKECPARRSANDSVSAVGVE